MPHSSSPLTLAGCLAAVFVATGMAGIGAADPDFLAHSLAARFAPMPAHVGAMTPLSLTTALPQSPVQVLAHLRTVPVAAIRIVQHDPYHDTIMPVFPWPASTPTHVTWQGRANAVTVTGDDDRAIHINLTRQTLTALDDGQPLKTFPINSGVPPRWTTPTGTYWIYRRVADDHMIGGDPHTPDHWDVDHVPYVQYFDDAIAIHGAWWAHRFGHPASHGCIQLATAQGPDGSTGDAPDAQWLWHFADIGTPVTVTGTTPSPTKWTGSPA